MPAPLRIDVLTTFPELFAQHAPAALGVSMPKRAIDAGAIEVVPTNIRDHAHGKHQKTDDRPFGGGPGMVMMCQPLYDATLHAESLDPRPAHRLLMSPQGERLTQPLVEELAGLGRHPAEQPPRLLIICGHYEGIDQRVIDELQPREVSLGDFVISGGELAALVLIDAIARLQPGVLGHGDSAGQDSFSLLPTTNPNGEPIDERKLTKWCDELGISQTDRLLDCPHYTRPREWNGRTVPGALLSGDHDAVMRWRLEQMAARSQAAKKC